MRGGGRLTGLLGLVRALSRTFGCAAGRFCVDIFVVHFAFYFIFVNMVVHVIFPF